MRILVSVINCVIQVVNTLVFSILMIKLIFDAFFIHQSYVLVLIYVACQILAQIVYELYSGWYSIYIEKSNYKIQEKIQLGIHEKYIKYDSIIFNRTEYYKKYNWVVENSVETIISVYDSIMNYVQAVIILILTGGIFILFDPIISVLVSCSVVIVFICDIKQNKNNYKKSKEVNDYSRYNNYIKRMFYLTEYREDMRLYDLDTVLLNSFEKNHRKIIKEQSTANKRILYTDIITNCFRYTLGGYLQYIIIGLKAILYNAYTVPELVTIINVTIKYKSSLSSLLSLFSQLKKNTLYLQDYYEYMEYEPEIKENEEGIIAEDRANAINIKNVSFSYDEKNKVLKNVNLSIKAGEKIAIVGYNGAGKSTLIKLILRLYLPQEGKIELDNVPADKYNLKSYRDRFGVAFQNSVIYAATVAENIMLQPLEDTKNDEMVTQAINKCGLASEINKYPEGIHTIMTKEFDENGIELSGGQKQKIALSRVFAKKSGVIILDEPSSALDPISEYEMYRNMLELSEGRTFIVISHRLSVTKDVDRIILLENGEIVESGSHQELINKGGKYAKMWNIQAKQYI